MSEISTDGVSGQSLPVDESKSHEQMSEYTFNKIQTTYLMYNSLLVLEVSTDGVSGQSLPVDESKLHEQMSEYILLIKYKLPT